MGEVFSGKVQKEVEVGCLEEGCNHTFLELRVGTCRKWGRMGSPAVRLRVSLYAGVLELWPQAAPPWLMWHNSFPLKSGPPIGQHHVCSSWNRGLWAQDSESKPWWTQGDNALLFAVGLSPEGYPNFDEYAGCFRACTFDTSNLSQFIPKSPGAIIHLSGLFHGESLSSLRLSSVAFISLWNAQCDSDMVNVPHFSSFESCPELHRP